MRAADFFCESNMAQVDRIKTSSEDSDFFQLFTDLPGALGDIFGGREVPRSHGAARVKLVG